MSDNSQDFIQRLQRVVHELDYIKPEELPNINLYMDQVTTFMEEQLASTKRHDSDKILTKTMINNYAKNRLLPPPDKKKYTKEHLLMLTFIYYFKNILSISDIQTLLSPITEKYFRSGTAQNMEYIYREIFSNIRDQAGVLEEDLVRLYQDAAKTFKDVPEEDLEFLQRFAYICLLSFDVYMKKQLIEQLIDEMAPQEKDKDSKKEQKKKGK